MRRYPSLMSLVMTICLSTSTVFPESTVIDEIALHRPAREGGHNVALNVDDVDVITEAARQAIVSLAALGKSKRSEAQKQSDIALLEIDALKLLIQNIRVSFADRQIKRLENQATKDEEFAKSSQAHRDKIRYAVQDFIRKLSEISNASKSIGVFTEVSKSRTQALTLIDLINKNDRQALSTLLKQNQSLNNLSIVDARTDNGPTLKFAVGNLVNCFSTKINCDSKTQSITLNPNLVLPESELKSLLESTIKRLTLGELLLRQIEELKEKRDEYQKKLREADQAYEQAMEDLVRLVKLLAEMRAAIGAF